MFEPVEIAVAVFLVAALYSSVGHGGASGYLGVLTLFGVAASVTRPTALILNLFVAGIAFVQFYRARHFDWKIFLPFAAASIPAAFLGGTMQLPQHIYKIILGAALVLAAMRLAINLKSNDDEANSSAPPVWVSILLGATLGLISGLIGIGGGIFLTPLLLICGWTTTKKAAGVSALFIWVNSAAGIAGNWLLGKDAQISNLPAAVWLWIAAAIVGGLAGATFGSFRFDSPTLRRVLAVGLTIAAAKLIFI